MRSIILVLILISFATIFYGCISFYESTGTDPLDYIDSYPYLFTNFETADAFCKKFDETIKGTKLRKDNILHQKVELILQKLEIAYKQLSDTKLLSYYDNKIDCRLNSYDRSLCPKIDISIYAICRPLAVSYPNGNIHLSRAFIDGDLQFSAKNSAQLTGLIAHEFIHIKHGHVGYQWAVAEAFNRFRSRQRKTNWSKFLRLLPISYSKTVYSTRDLSEIYFIDYNLECMADFFTTIILDHMGYNAAEYIELLINLQEYMKKRKNPDQRKIEELSLRVNCLKSLLISDMISFPKYLIIERKNIYEDSHYFHYTFSRYPILKNFAIYWASVLKTIGKPSYVGRFVIYPNSIAMPAGAYRGSDLRLKTELGYINPLEVNDGIVIPEKLVEIPIFPFLYQ